MGMYHNAAEQEKNKEEFEGCRTLGTRENQEIMEKGPYKSKLSWAHEAHGGIQAHTNKSPDCLADWRPGRRVVLGLT
jgi:hypothetical protein